MSSLFSWSEENCPFHGICPVCVWHEKALSVRTSITSGDPVVLQKCQSLMQINGQAGCYQTQSGNEDRTYSSCSQDSVSLFWPLPDEFIEWCREGDLVLRAVHAIRSSFSLLQQLKKAFCNCIIVAVTAMAHADFNSM
ncbi:hypothetical protein [Pantoea sp. Sc1]|uniref:hypothetical protein n=1 Tax=Pantoea sp. Sc1 TaxID=593105 RepID=UPI001ED8D4F6|nr:hypothetical protein [Pantoea sp. Sc1]